MDIVSLKQNYAKTIIGAGVDLQEGQLLHISCPVQLADFAVLVAEEGFKRGAKDVEIDYTDTRISRLRYTHATEEALQNPPAYKAEARKHFTSNGSALVTLSLVDPHAFDGIDAGRMMTASTAMRTLLADANKLMFPRQCSFTMACVPEETWAKAVFPDRADALELLWQKVCAACRVTESDPVASWRQFSENIKRRAAHMNELQFDTIHMKNKLGTDLQIKLVKNHVWSGGGLGWGGRAFFPNLPTEEVFTAPDRMQVNGKAVASMPLVYNGKIIRDFWFEFKDGKVVNFDAKEGFDVLKSIVEADENSCRLGEIALVPHDSPISKLDTLFFNTMFDENAACHLALGNSYPNTLQNSRGLTNDEMLAAGMNISKVHVDFMVGNDDMDITATDARGNKLPVFKNGVWAI